MVMGMVTATRMTTLILASSVPGVDPHAILASHRQPAARG
jgi:hypothetical protein